MYKLNVLMTVDVECWPQNDYPLGKDIREQIAYHVFGETQSKEALGINWQMDIMSQHGFRGVFFVESLCATRGFHQCLRDVVTSIQSRGHDIELHVHTEWFGFPPAQSLIGNKCAQHLKDYSLEEQVTIIAAAKKALEECGVDSIVAFRAGNFGADENTLKAAKTVGIQIDSSYNPVYVGRACGLRFSTGRSQPFRINGMWEYPVTCYRDRPLLQRNHLRPLQITASSFREMSAVLYDAFRRRMHTIVILTHSFEMTHFSPGSTRAPKRNSLNAHRFRRLCRFLHENSDLFRVTTFKEIVKDNLFPAESLLIDDVPRSATINYLLRGTENLLSTVFKY